MKVLCKRSVLLGLAICIFIFIAVPQILAQKNALIQAYRADNLPVVESMLIAGFDANARDEDGSTPLIVASQNGYKQILLVLLAHGADVDAKNFSNGDTALIAAVRMGHVELVRALLKAGANLNIKATNGETALTIALHKGDRKVMLTLRDAEFIANAKAEEGDKGLIAAAASGNLKLVRELLAAGADVNAKTVKGSTALIEVSLPTLESTRSKNDSSLSNTILLSEYVTSIGVSEMVAQSSFQRNHWETARALLEFNADVNAVAEHGVTALIAASMSGNAEIARALIAANADVNARMDNGRTALMEAAVNEYPEVFIELENAGADLDAKDNDGNTAWTLASREHHEPILHLIRLAKGLEY